MKQEESSKSAPSPSELFSFFLHQDNLMWNRLQTLGVVQIGALSSAYGLRTTQWLSLSILVLGIVLSLLIFFLLKRDEMIRGNTGTLPVLIILQLFGVACLIIWEMPLYFPQNIKAKQ